MAEYIGVSIISIAVIVFFILLLVCAAGPGTKGSWITGRTKRVNNPALFISTAPTLQSTIFDEAYSDRQPLTLNHGTTLKNAFEILNSGLWLIGPTCALWMTSDIEIAKQHSGENGGIVVINVAPSLQLTTLGGGIYTYNIPNAMPYQEYYKIDGLTPVGILSPAGEKIR
jgi:hypothetical protein